MANELADVVAGDAEIMLQDVLVPASGRQDAGVPSQDSGPRLMPPHRPDPLTPGAVPYLPQSKITGPSSSKSMENNGIIPIK